MKHTPFGYDIVDGGAKINEDAAEKVRGIFAGYLLGLSLAGAAQMVGLDLKHTSAKRILTNRRYLGDDFYPQIIDKETFEAVGAEFRRREKTLGRDNLRRKERTVQPVQTMFRLERTGKKYNDPIKQAEYVYSKIKETI